MYIFRLTFISLTKILKKWELLKFDAYKIVGGIIYYSVYIDIY